VESFDGAAQFMRGDARVALPRVEVLVPEEFMDLEQVGACTHQFRGEDVPERTRGDPLSGVTPAARA
jgi:hypothetical protein